MDISIDYEIRYISKYAYKKLKSHKLLKSLEPICVQKLRNFKKNKKKISNYFSKAKKIKKIILRPLFFNSKKIYYDQLNNLKKDFLNEVKIPDRIKIEESLQIPNFNYIKFDEIKKIIDNYKHFDLNFTWYQNVGSLKPYKKIINIIDKKKGNLCFEMHDNSEETNNILNFLSKKKNIKILIPSFSRLNCFSFHNRKFFKKKNVFFLTSAAYSYSIWYKILRLEFKKNKILFGTDHPFNNLKSLKMYNYFKNK